MSVHIDDPSRVTALLISGVWLGVEAGTLERHTPPRGSSGTTAIVYHWDHAGYRYVAEAGDVKAVQIKLVDS